MRTRKRITRRDHLLAIARRAGNLTPDQEVIAWRALTIELETLSDKDIPKFRDLTRAIRIATIKGRDPKNL